jgi:hypothetical protein
LPAISDGSADDHVDIGVPSEQQTLLGEVPLRGRDEDGGHAQSALSRLPPDAV